MSINKKKKKKWKRKIRHLALSPTVNKKIDKVKIIHEKTSCSTERCRNFSHQIQISRAIGNYRTTPIGLKQVYINKTGQ